MNATIFVTSLMTLASVHALNWKKLLPECPWLPICVTTPVSRAAAISRSTSRKVCASGFST
jgi:hypothetical protein